MGFHWIILTGEDCPHCIELQAQLEGKEGLEWMPTVEADTLLQKDPLLAASVDILPYAILISNEIPVAYVRAATPERMAEAENIHLS
jgi:hypothetical protein